MLAILLSMSLLRAGVEFEMRFDVAVIPTSYPIEPGSASSVLIPKAAIRHRGGQKFRPAWNVPSERRLARIPQVDQRHRTAMIGILAPLLINVTPL